MELCELKFGYRIFAGGRVVFAGGLGSGVRGGAELAGTLGRGLGVAAFVGVVTFAFAPVPATGTSVDIAPLVQI